MFNTVLSIVSFYLMCSVWNKLKLVPFLHHTIHEIKSAAL